MPAAALGATDGDEDMAAAMEDLDADEELQRALALSRGEDVEMG